MPAIPDVKIIIRLIVMFVYDILFSATMSFACHKYRAIATWLLRRRMLILGFEPKFVSLKIISRAAHDFTMAQAALIVDYYLITLLV